LATGAANYISLPEYDGSAACGSGREVTEGAGLWKSSVSDQYYYFCLQTNSRAMSPKFPSASAPN
jgi:hypothetical protein